MIVFFILFGCLFFPLSASAAGFVDLTQVTLSTVDLTAAAALIIPVLLGLFVYRKVVKTTNRS